MNALSLIAMNVITVVEEEAVVDPPARLIDVNKMVDYFWENITNLPWMVALLVISVGIVYMLYGWRIFRVLMCLLGRFAVIRWKRTLCLRMLERCVQHWNRWAAPRGCVCCFLLMDCRKKLSLPVIPISGKLSRRQRKLFARWQCQI